MWLFLAILLEVAATVCMKLSEGFTRWIPTISMVVLYSLSFFPMAWALRRLEVGTVYAVWSAVGTALVSVLGVYLFKEVMTPAKMSALALIVLGVLILNLSEPQVPKDGAANGDRASLTTSADTQSIFSAEKLE